MSAVKLGEESIFNRGLSSSDTSRYLQTDQSKQQYQSSHLTGEGSFTSKEQAISAYQKRMIKPSDLYEEVPTPNHIKANRHNNSPITSQRVKQKQLNDVRFQIQILKRKLKILENEQTYETRQPRVQRPSLSQTQALNSDLQLRYERLMQRDIHKYHGSNLDIILQAASLETESELRTELH